MGSEADFLQKRVLYVNWDVDELVNMKSKIEEGNQLTVGVKGWDSTAMYI